MKIIVLGAGVIGVTGAWYLAEAGHEVTVVERRAKPGWRPRSPTAARSPPATPSPGRSRRSLPKILRWLGREDAPLLFRPRADRAQWEWGLRFLLECLPGRFERNCRALAGLAGYSRDCLRALRSAAGIQYDHLTRGILQFATSDARFRRAWRARRRRCAPLGVRREVKSAAECLALEPALAALAASRWSAASTTPQDESGDAHRFTRELARLAAARGVTFRFGTAVEALEAAGGRSTALRTHDGERHARRRLRGVAREATARLLLAPLGIRIPVYPLKGYSITLPSAPARRPRRRA